MTTTTLTLATLAELNAELRCAMPALSGCELFTPAADMQSVVLRDASGAVIARSEITLHDFISCADNEALLRRAQRIIQEVIDLHYRHYRLTGTDLHHL